MSSSYEGRDSDDQLQDQRMRKINSSKHKYKRSTNNSHKKFIAIAKKLLFQHFTAFEEQDFIQRFDQHKNSRTYYFILLSHIKQKMNPQQKTYIHNHFNLQLNQKVERYTKEIEKATNTNFVNFRCDQIEDIQFALKAFDLYLEGRFVESIELIYKKNRNVIMKKRHFQQTLYFMLQLEKIFNPDYDGGLNDYFLSKEKSSISNLNNWELQKRGVVNKDAKGQNSDDESWSQTLKSHYKVKSKGRKQQMRQRRIKDVKITPKCENQYSRYPLLHLQNSYPIYPYFFDTVFSYENAVSKHPNVSNFQYPYFNPLLSQNYGLPLIQPNNSVNAISGIENVGTMIKAQVFDIEMQ